MIGVELVADFIFWPMQDRKYDGFWSRPIATRLAAAKTPWLESSAAHFDVLPLATMNPSSVVNLGLLNGKIFLVRDFQSGKPATPLILPGCRSSLGSANVFIARR
jgi:hypothetical protein